MEIYCVLTSLNITAICSIRDCWRIMFKCCAYFVNISFWFLMLCRMTISGHTIVYYANEHSLPTPHPCF